MAAMDLAEWTSRLETVSAGYAEAYAVDRTPEWMLLKLLEELGELSQAWLVASGQGRDRGRTAEEQRQSVAAECADVVAMALLTAHRMGVDVEAALEEKWLPWEHYHTERRKSGATVTPPITLDSNAFRPCNNECARLEHRTCRGAPMNNWPTSAKVVVVLLILLIVVPAIFKLVWLAVTAALVLGIGYVAIQAISRKR